MTTTNETSRERLERCLQKVEEKPDSAKAHYNLGLAYTELRKMTSAKEAYQKAVELEPGMVEAWVNLGGAHLLSWEFEAALKANDQALEIDPELLVAHYNRGQALLYLNDPEEMLRSFEKVVALDPQHAAGHYYMAVALLANGRVQEAREYTSRASALGHRPRPEFMKELEKREKGLPPTPPDGEQN